MELWLDKTGQRLPQEAGEWEDAVPDEYQSQIQHYMAVTGYARAYIAVLIGGNTFRWNFVDRDEELIYTMPLSLESSEKNAKKR